MRIDPDRLSPAVAYGMLTATMACLALNHVIGRGMHELAPPVGLSFWRWTVAAVLMLAIVGRGLGAKLPVYRRHSLLFLGLGALMVGSTTLLVWSLQFTQAMNVSLINGLQPAMTVLMTFVFLQQRLTLLQIAGVVVGFVGVLAMVSKGSWQVVASLSFNRGDIGALIGMFGLAAYAIGLRWLPRGLRPFDALFGITVAGCLALLPIYAAESLSGRPFALTPETAGAVLAMGTIGSVAGNLMWNIGNQALGANKASIFVNLIPVFGVVMAIAFLGETLRPYHVVGFGLICAGVWCVLARRMMNADTARVRET